MFIDTLSMFESPVQILFVLTLALLLFGPKKLPEVGRQLGGALRELRKAMGDVSRSFTTEYEPDSSSYSYSTPSSYDRTASYYTPPAIADAPMDLSDYTIVGVTPPEPVSEPGTANQSVAVSGMDLADYTLAGTPGHGGTGGGPADHLAAKDGA